MNNGKAFEAEFKDSFKDTGISIDRLYDGTGGYAVRNICDFIVFSSPCIFYFELKSYSGDYIYLDVITNTQFKGLVEKASYTNVIPGVIFNFNDYGEGEYFVHIKILQEMLNNGSNKITIDEAKRVGVKMPILKKRRVTKEYDVKLFLKQLKSEYEVKL